jgi:DNA-directed RNA polymerase specialized sigma24 family protein
MHAAGSLGNERGQRGLPPALLAHLRLSAGLGTTDGDLDGALSEHLAGLVRVVVRSTLFRHRSASAEDLDDVCSDSMVALLGRMEEFRANPQAASAIENFDAYVAVIARRACSAWARRRYPAFHRLRTRLRALLSSDAHFALWQNAGGDWLCGKPEWQQAMAEPRSIEAENFGDVVSSAKPTQALVEIFTHTGRPLYFNDLARVCAQLWSVVDTPETMESVEPLPVAGAGMESVLDRRSRLQHLWKELRDLPQSQCAALLLNLRGPDGECATSLLVLTGTASVQAVAEAVGLSPESFAELWSRLPLSDLEIAERMGLTRQQVINLRKCARERLRRRMGGG